MAAPRDGQHYTLDVLGDGVYAAIARDGGAAIGNSGFVDLGGATLVVDTFVTPTAAEALRADIERLTGRAPRWVINTHYHNDHIWGNQVFLPEADLISTVRTRTLIQTAGKEEYDDYRAVADAQLKKWLGQQAAAKGELQRANADLMAGYFRGLVDDFPRLRVTLPNMVFENHMVLYGSKRRVELIAFADAHSGSDTVVYLPDDGILFMSDLLFIGFHPYVADGDPDGWLRVLRSIRDGTAGAPNVRRFVPGHGPTGTQADLEQLESYIETSQQIARQLATDGKSSEADAATAPIPDAYADWMLPRFFYANLSFLLRQYKGEKEPALAAGRVSNSFRP